MATKRTVLLRGEPIINEDGVASATIAPGYLVKGVTTIALQDADGATKVPATFAVERDELGRGIDNTYQGSGTGSAYYASGDVVKVASCYPGCRVTAYVGSGENVAVGSNLSPAGDGTLEVTDSTDYIIARALEAHAPNVVAGDAAIAIEII